MFEKEAEEYANQSCFTEMPNPSLSEDIDISDEIKEAVLYGYNKANEWHYVKGGDLPPEDTKVLALMAGGEVCIAHFYKRNVWDKIGTVYAWKEIVLPELSKEIKENE